MDILKTIYSKTWTLQDWLIEIDKSTSIVHQVLYDRDSKQYRDLLKTTVVACQEEKMPSCISFSQISEQKELLSHVIQKLKKRNEKNVLTQGFTAASDNKGAQVAHVFNLEIFSPNSSVSRLQRPVWCKLLSRVGDFVMEFLLENMSVFMELPSSNYIQLAGVPIYELWPVQPGKFLCIPQKSKRIQGYKRKIKGHYENKSKKRRYCRNDSDVEIVSCQGGPYSSFTSVKCCKRKKKKKKKSVQPVFSAYNYHTCINRIPMLYAKNLREKFTNKYILNVIPRTLDGAVILYGHILEHKQTVFTKKAKITWELPDHSENSMCNESYCSIQTDHKDIDESAYHLSFFSSGQSFDKIITKYEENHSGSKYCSQQKDLAVLKAEHENHHIKDIDVIDSRPFHNSLSSIENSCRFGTCNLHGNECSQGFETSGDVNSFANSQGFEISENDSFLTISQMLRKIEVDSSAQSKQNICDNELGIMSEGVHKNLREPLIFKRQSNQFTKIKMRKIERLNSKDCFTSTPLESGTQEHDSNIMPSNFQRRSAKRKDNKNSGELSQKSRKKCLLKRKSTDDDEIVRQSKRFCVAKDRKLESEENCLNYVEMQTEHTIPVREKQCENMESDVDPLIGKDNPISTGCTKIVLKDHYCEEIVKDIDKNVQNKNCTNTDHLRSTKIKKLNFILNSNDRGLNGIEQQTSMKDEKKENMKFNEISVNKQMLNERVDEKLDERNEKCTILPVKVAFNPLLYDFLHQVLIKHRRCPYRFLLDHYCPVKRIAKKSLILRRGQRYFSDVRLIRKTSVRENLQNFVPHQQVYLFVRRICLYVIPEELWGCRSNRNRFCRSIMKIISLNKYDKFCIGQLMSGIKVKTIPWLKAVKSNSVRQHIVAKVWHWIIDEFVLGIIKTYFYVTDTTQHVNRLFYYRKKTWQWLHTKALSDLMKRNIMKLIPVNTARQLVSDKQSLGVASIRFLPKDKNLRPIINLGRQQTQFGISRLPINKKLLNLLQALSSIKKKHPEIVGAGKFGLDEVYKVWKDFCDDKRQPLYFVKTDITSCYDEILQHKLFSIIRKLFMNPEIVSSDFVTRRYVKIVNESGVIKRKFMRKAHQLGDDQPDFVLFAKQQIMEDKTHNVIFVDQVEIQQETTEQLLRLLHCHIFHNIIKIGQSYYKQTKGISQGSVISTLLCNIYYGEIEKLFPVEEGELMMRIVDDALFVTPCKERAVAYCKRMVSGIPDFNFSINKKKVQTNIPELDEDITVIVNTDWLSWCGILLNMRTLETTVNLSFYCKSSLEDTMTFDTAYSAGNTLKRKLLRSIRLKCHPLFLDSEVNSLNVVIINIYKTFLLSAYKFVHYIKRLPRKDNYKFYVGIITEFGRYFYSVYRHVMKNKALLKLKLAHIEWLCSHAFITKCNQHRSLYKNVVSGLQEHKIRLAKNLKEENMTTGDLQNICGNKLLDFQERML